MQALASEIEFQTLKEESNHNPSHTLSERQICDLELILNGGFNINFREEYANKFFVERSGLAYKRIDSSIRSYLY